jgi:hypothetical protein
MHSTPHFAPAGHSSSSDLCHSSTTSSWIVACHLYYIFLFLRIFKLSLCLADPQKRNVVSIHLLLVHSAPSLQIIDEDRCSVLPPPPRYTTQAAYNAAVAAGQAVPMIETNNILSNPTGPEYQLLVGEGEARRIG